MILLGGGFGQLGNRLHTFAHVIAAATDLGATVVNLGFGPYSRHFGRLSQDPLCSYPPKAMALSSRPRLARAERRSLGLAVKVAFRTSGNAPLVGGILIGWGRECDLSSQAFADLARRKKILVLHGFRFVHPNIDRYRDRIRQVFVPAKVHLDRCDGIIRAAKERSHVLVGIHVRRGDYRSFAEGVYDFGHDVYLRLMKHVGTLFPDQRIVFLICSNEELNLYASSAFDCSFGTGVDIEDLYALAACDYLMGPPSTFSGWASFYGDVPRWVITESEGRPTLQDFIVNRKLGYPKPARAHVEKWTG